MTGKVYLNTCNQIKQFVTNLLFYVPKFIYGVDGSLQLTISH